MKISSLYLEDKEDKETGDDSTKESFRHSLSSLILDFLNQ
jgi:hypothetical protein